ncbi:helix-turn-helix domain-containing protein [Nocardia seriolae]|uniref:DNA-binding protein n=1 Tax=Nocardia seriolae TaxID=37332 RepID=A0A0B8NAG3_9NOCA|nr:helix-turn-helix transcriptional regulator [Nocardia seriolae]MTJ66681.1 helix-turn-helix domain-containing protein [Nocardia seriolae]MTJ72097.1 helix-turn-helix domain-containing protein [Nocardia seriolae]MTJ85480.1 helix-turn-helix domain-containing protein [Nocardia seriolae]MTK29478.1 helix-turn-helix domain-containing protein [Nocardia seriolae]MTK44613.1 helix-turn-helix domain-containing protein [Nocardia seriolae]
MSRSEFAEFLIARRAQLQPEDVGLPSGRRRRTPGLRREEVAALAGVSADYLARLEQGRDTNPSTAVLVALADALRLNEIEKHHFGKLALGLEQKASCPAAGQAREQVSETIQAVIDALQPTPAFVLGRWLNLLAGNPAFQDFAAPLGMFEEESHGNFANYVFAHPTARKVFLNWEVAADMAASSLRTVVTRFPDDPSVQAVITMLSRYPEFEQRWREHRLSDFRTVVLRIQHPVQGEVEVEVETLDPAADQTIVVWLVDRRQARTPGLRLVNE